jgi:hypothetical protein
VTNRFLIQTTRKILFKEVLVSLSRTLFSECLPVYLIGIENELIVISVLVSQNFSTGAIPTVIL